MGVQFDHPWVLLLLLPLAGWAVYTYRSDYRLRGGRKAWVIGIRSTIITLLILVLAGFHTYSFAKDKEIVFLLDRSESMSTGTTSLGSAEQWMLEAGLEKKKQDKVGVVSSGLDAIVEKNLDSFPLTEGSLGGEPNSGFTRLEQGLQLSGSLFGGQGNRRIVLISDGEENVGDIRKAAMSLKERGIAVDVLPVAKAELKDAAIESFKVPEKLYRAESFSFEVSIRSTFSVEGELRLYEDNLEIGRKTVSLEKGDNRFALQGLASETGLHRYRAELFVDGDEQSGNNANYAFTRVTGNPKVLIVEGETGTSANMENALSSGLVQYEVTKPDMLSSDIAKYAQYDSIIFNNVSGDQVGGKQMELIEQAVRSYGIGFMMVGGEDSYGMGGYFKTPIEKLLPVSMELEGKREVPSLGLILVIDRSGSMDGDKIALAKESAMRTVELLRPKDTVGVVAFDDKPWWVVEPQKLDDKEAVISQISSIPSGGGTDIFPALASATEKMLEVTAQRKHIILLTDGQSAINSSYNDLIATMKDSKITMSSVAVGDDADFNLLSWLADEAKGRYYLVKDATTLPAIFSREAAMIARTYIVNKQFVPSLVTPGEWGEMLGGGLPGIQGYVAATTKSTAQTILASPEPDPLLARWQYGSGRTIAWTSDLTGKWSKEWVNWSSFPSVFTEMVKWTFPQFTASPYEVNTTVIGNEVQFEVTVEGGNPPEHLEAVVSSEKLEESRVNLMPTSPGTYTGVMEVSHPGSFLLNLQEKSSDSEPGAANGENNTLGTGTGFVIPYSPEYRIQADDAMEKLIALADMTGGRVLDWSQAKEVFTFSPKSYPIYRDLERLLLAAALILWVIDIALRRLALPWGRIAERLLQWRRRGTLAAATASQRGASAAKPDTGLARLAARKDRAAAFYGAGGKDSASAPQAPRPRPEADGTGAAPERPAREVPRAAEPPTAPPPAEGAGRQAGAGVAAPGDALGRLLAAKRRGKR
ncbi:von Willebrand factor type A domain protein [compost metagenome]